KNIVNLPFLFLIAIAIVGSVDGTLKVEAEGSATLDGSKILDGAAKVKNRMESSLGKLKSALGGVSGHVESGGSLNHGGGFSASQSSIGGGYENSQTHGGVKGTLETSFSKTGHGSGLSHNRSYAIGKRSAELDGNVQLNFGGDAEMARGGHHEKGFEFSHSGGHGSGVAGGLQGQAGLNSGGKNAIGLGDHGGLGLGAGSQAGYESSSSGELSIDGAGGKNKRESGLSDGKSHVTREKSVGFDVGGGIKNGVTGSFGGGHGRLEHEFGISSSGSRGSDSLFGKHLEGGMRLRRDSQSQTKFQNDGLSADSAGSGGKKELHGASVMSNHFKVDIGKSKESSYNGLLELRDNICLNVDKYEIQMNESNPDKKCFCATRRGVV
ncbi:hypothetical protein QAD02_005724, partial [Eretmocerus hayati]